MKPKPLIKRALFSTIENFFTDAVSLGKNCKPQVTYKSRLSTSMHAWFAAMEPVFTLFVGTIMMRIQDKTNLLREDSSCRFQTFGQTGFQFSTKILV